ncbi:MAG TPA: hypothetical protein DCQ31_11780, partial [Bacteroidales bacterium]|nr:hypothetical protein [Bacteroidales bacterium]
TWDGYMVGNYWIMTKEGLSISGKLINPDTGEVMEEEMEMEMQAEPDSLLDPELEDMKKELKT